MNGDDSKEENNELMNHNNDVNSKKTIKKQDKKNSMESEAELEDFEIPEDLPPKMRKRVEAIFSMGSISRSNLSPFESKINEKHIDKILEIKEKYDDKIFRDTQHSRKFLLVYVLIGVALFVFLTLFLVGRDKELLRDIIKLFIAFVGGLGAGVGIKHYLDNK